MIYDLQHAIRQQIIQSLGQIGFADYMQQALYHPEYGYYSASGMTLGKDGDFTTAPEISPLFAECIARLALQVCEQVGKPNILEIGAGSGRLAKDLLLTLNATGTQAQYYIYEISPSLQSRQLALLQENGLAEQVTWLDKLPSDFSGLIVANEVLDALPVSRIQVVGEQIKECCVTFESQGFTWQLNDTLPPEWAEYADHIVSTYMLPDGYTTEIHSRLQAFVNDVANCLTNGMILFADYGYGQREYYHPQRTQGTLTCFYKHQRHADPFYQPGRQDITAHVDFSAVAEYAVEANCELLGFTSLSAFLFDCGLMDIAASKAQNLSAVDEFKLNQSIKILTMPTEMGDIVKVSGLAKNLDFKPLGFGLLDRRRDL